MLNSHLRRSLFKGRHLGLLGCSSIVQGKISHSRGSIIRYYSSGRDDNSIEEFKKRRKEYSFGGSMDPVQGSLSSRGAPDGVGSNSRKTHDRMSKFEEPEEDDLQRLIENDPRLINLRPGSPEYKYQMHLIQMEVERENKKRNSKEEFYQRVKGAAIGLVAIVGAIALHQLIMNYEFVKNTLLHSFRYDLDESKVPDTISPLKNTKKISYLVSKIGEQLSDKFVGTLRPSENVAGIYLFGTDSKLPMRLNYFDGMLIKDVKIYDDYVVVVNEKGKVYEVIKREPTLKSIPYKAEKCEITDDSVYLLTNKGQVVYFPRADKPNTSFKPIEATNWLGVKKKQSYNILDTNEAIKNIASGAHHLLLLSQGGKLFISNTSDKALNQGQYGLPQYSPFENKSEIPVNKVFELTLANNQIVSKKDGTRTLLPRLFDSIASGKYHNVAADVNGNIWTWGRNVYGECGVDVSYDNEYFPIPKAVFGNEKFHRILRNSLKEKPSGVSIDAVYASDETSFICLTCNFPDPENGGEIHQNVVLAFGNGLKGQLGVNRFLHVCPEPQVIKSLLNLKEYDEKLNKSRVVNIKDISASGGHAFITLDNIGNHKDVLAFGNNEFGQLGNGKLVRSSKPVQLPQLIEPEELASRDSKSIRKVAERVNDTLTKRLQLLDGHKLKGKTEIEQVIVAGGSYSAIFYRCK